MLRLHMVESLEGEAYNFEKDFDDVFIPGFKEIFERESVLKALGINGDESLIKEYLMRLDKISYLIKTDEDDDVEDASVEIAIHELLKYYDYEYMLKLDNYGTAIIISLVILNVKRG